MSQAHDAVVVGAGPAGLSAAVEIAARGGRCVIVERGRSHRVRTRDEILAGVGGAGLFSDGKHSFYPAATELWRLPGVESAYAATATLLRRFGVHAPPFPEAARSDLGPHGGEASLLGGEPGSPPLGRGSGRRPNVKDYPSIYASLEDRRRCIAELCEAAGELPWLDATVVGASRDRGLVLDVAQGGERRRLEARALVIATGRLSPRWIRGWLEPLGVRFAFRRLEFGVRLEARSDAALFRRLEGVDPKISWDDEDGHRVLTFCTCRDGEVVHGVSGDVHAVSGRADGPPTGRSSVGILARVVDADRAAAIAPYVFAGEAPWSAPLASLRAGALEATFGPLGGAIVTRAVARFVERFGAPSDATIHAPCIEGVGDYPVSDDALALAPDVFIAGDACGRFRGIVASMVSGRLAGARVMRGPA